MSATIQPAPALTGMDAVAMAQICHSYKWLVDVPTVLGVGAALGQQFANPKLTMPVCGQAMNVNPGFTTRLVGRKVSWTHSVFESQAPGRRVCRGVHCGFW